VNDAYPIQRSPNGHAKYLIAVGVVGAAGVAWVLFHILSFAAARIQSTSTPGVVVGYEMAGGMERLRVQTSVEGKPKGFMLLDGSDAWPRYRPNQPVEVLTREVRNKYGQTVPQSTVYAARNYWQKQLAMLVAALAASCAGIIGLVRLRRRGNP
jgi:hypothetical protein